MKRWFDLAVATLGLVCLAPVFLIIALAIKLDSSGPVFFRQERVGLNGRLFRIHKFRTMRARGASEGGEITVGADQRITRVGRFLRKFKLDELAQLIDVLKGSMSLVGPRPEVPRYVALYPPEVRTVVLSVRPGITDWASIEFRDEAAVLAGESDPEAAYVHKLLPQKLIHYEQYARNHSFRGDLKILAATLAAVMRMTP